jgi:hypothetical protein
MRKLFGKASQTSYRIGAALGLAHLAISWWILIDLARQEPDAQWQLVWVLFLPFDLPFSLLVLFGGLLFPHWIVEGVPYPMSDFRGFILPAIIHGIVGPLWYFIFPVAISAFLNRRG